MPTAPFVHLHCHTHYSLLDGACKIPDLVRQAKMLGMDSLAITDHGCMFGVIEFFNECTKEGIKPILGMEAYMAPGDRRERSTPSGSGSDAAYHLLLLCQDLQGYRNLVKISSIAYREGFYYKPRIDKQILREFNQGLIATSACLGGEIPSNLLRRDAKSARQIAETYLDIFGPDRFFIEVQKQGIELQDIVNPELADLAKRLGVGLVATNDVHFLTKDDHYAHDVLCCISMGRLITDEGRLKYPDQLYLKSPEEMAQALGQFDQAIENTARIASQCNVELTFGKRHAPVYRVAAEQLKPQYRERFAATMADDERYLRQLCEEGLKWRFGEGEIPPEIRQRLEHELAIISSKNFCSYFLIVWDFCNFARERGIPAGARGSAVGTMVGYLLGLCNVDPMRYGLLFERFMDPNRDEMPDIDIDICQDGRAKVIEYVRQKYGHVAQIITFGTLAAKAVCKDVGRVLGVPLSVTDRLTKLIPVAVGMNLDKALAQSVDLAKLYNEDAQIRKIVDIGKRLEGLCRNAGMHAAGVVIADQPLDELLPLCKSGDDLLTQFEGPIVDKIGLLKMDFLGLRTLSVLQRSIDLVRQTKGIEIDIEKIDFGDETVLKLFGSGQTRGIFQFESGGMTDLLMKMKPDRLEDLIAANALYRPGPMELIPLYCNRKHRKEPVQQLHPIIDHILAETYGIMVYQEQVMQIFNQLGGIELSAAYKLIKAISKKTTEVIARFKPDFLAGALANGVSREQAQEIFELILKFGGYGFNKSHSTRYAIVAFQTAYMKAYHPVEYMAALLTFEMGNTDKVVEYIDECRRVTLPDGPRGIKVLPPDVNDSDRDFTPIYVTESAGKRKKPTQVGVIRFGLMAVRGVGEKAANAIIEERQKRGPFSSLFDFCERIDQRQINRSTIEALIKCGAFASTKARRAQLLAGLDAAVEMAQQSQLDQRLGQLNMFASGSTAAAPSRPHEHSLPNLEEFPSAQLLKFEKEMLGFYVTSHPLTEHLAALAAYGTATSKEIKTLAQDTDVVIGGMIGRIKRAVTKKGRSAGQPMAIVTLEDLEGQIDGTIFAENLADIEKRYPDAVTTERIVFLRGKVDKRRETPGIIVSDVIPIEDAVSRLTRAIKIAVETPDATQELLSRVKLVLARHKGNCDLFLQLPANGVNTVIIRLDSQWSVRPTPALKLELDSTLNDHGKVELAGDGTRRIKRQQQQKLFRDAEPVETAMQSSPAEMSEELL